MILLDIESDLMYNNKCENNIMRNITNSIFLGCPHRFYLHPLLKIDTQKTNQLQNETQCVKTWGKRRIG